MPRESPQSDPALRAYLKEICEIPLLTHEQEISLARAVAKGEEKARQTLILSNLRLVISIAKKFVNRGMPLADLIEEGNLGLMHAVERYDPDKGTRFSTYATYWIKQAIRRALTNKSKTIRLPAYMVETVAKWKQAASQLADTLGREPTIQEVADALKISPRKVGIIRRALRAAAVSTSFSPDTSWLLGDVVRDTKTPSPEENLFTAVEHETLQRLLNAIDKREAEILRLRYGLDNGESMTLQQIGDQLNVARERVRQIENQALHKLKAIVLKEE